MVVVVMLCELRSQGSLQAAADEGVNVVGFLLLVVVVIVTVDKKVVGGAEVLKIKLCLLSLVPPSRVPSKEQLVINLIMQIYSNRTVTNLTISKLCYSNRAVNMLNYF